MPNAVKTIHTTSTQTRGRCGVYDVSVPLAQRFR